MTTLQTPLTLAVTATASATLVAGKHTPVDATSGAKTMTLPTPTTVGARLRVEKVDTSANTVTISGAIRGSAATITLTSQFETQELFAESLTSWRVASSHRTKAATDAAYDATGAAAGAQAFAVQRANHTGTQSADTLTDGTTNKAYTAAEKTKLGGVAAGATAYGDTQAQAANAAVVQNTKSNPLRGVPVADNTWTHANNAANTQIATSRRPFTLAVDATDLRLVFTNWYNNGSSVSPLQLDQDNPNPITIAASVEISGVKYRITFGGQASYTLGSGGRVETDPLPLDLPAGTLIYVWTAVNPVVGWYGNAYGGFTFGMGGRSVQRIDTATVTSASATVSDTAITAVDFGKPVTGTGIPANTYVGTVTAGTSFLLSSKSGSQTNVNANAAGTSVTIGGDLTDPAVGSATIPDTGGSYMYGPAQVVGRPLQPLSGQTTTPVALLVGDSVMAGSNDILSTYAGRNVSTPALAGGGFTARALYGKVPYIMAACSGDQASLFVTAAGHFRRLSWAAAGTTMLCNYGRNDLSSGRTLAQVQADLLTIWTMGARRGQRVIQYTITPYTDSTDSWITTANQTPRANGQESVRVTLNNWIRDGAPVTSPASLTPVATGTAGALRAGGSGHPLTTYFEVADLAESARDSGLWRILSGRTVTDAAITSGLGTLTSATAAFTTADLGTVVTVAGAGAAGALLVTTVDAYNSATSVHLNTNASTTVSGGTATINLAATKDGLHPSSPVSVLMAVAIDLTKIV